MAGITEFMPYLRVGGQRCSASHSISQAICLRTCPAPNREMQSGRLGARGGAR